MLLQLAYHFFAPAMHIATYNAISSLRMMYIVNLAVPSIKLFIKVINSTLIKPAEGVQNEFRDHFFEVRCPSIVAYCAGRVET